MKKSITTIMLAVLTMSAAAQTENPRGVYKMTTLTGKLGEVIAPYEQYKICTDSITLMVTEEKNVFHIYHNDSEVFNYTGSEPSDNAEKNRVRIYDSNDREFKLKWWSSYANHVYFPQDDWCIEKYESGRYTELSKLFFDAFTGTAEVDAKNPLTGTWRFIGYIDDFRDAKKDLPKVRANYKTSKYFNSFMVFTPNSLTTIFTRGGGVDKIQLNGKKSYQSGKKTFQIKWLSKNCIAIEDRIDYRTDWMILERVTDGTSPLDNIASQYLHK